MVNCFRGLGPRSTRREFGVPFFNPRERSYICLAILIAYISLFVTNWTRNEEEAQQQMLDYRPQLNNYYKIEHP